MKNKQLVNAYKTLDRISSQPLPVKTAYTLFKLKRKLASAYNFCEERERALFEKLRPTLTDDNRLKFATVEDREAWDREENEIDNMESDIEVEPITLPMSDELKLTLDDIEKLEGFVTFTEE